MDARDLEVRCEACDAGFAEGTRTCVHCNRPLGRRSRAPQATRDLFDPATSDEAPSEGDEDEGELRRASFWGNLVPTLAAIAFVLVSFILRACDGA